MGLKIIPDQLQTRQDKTANVQKYARPINKFLKKNGLIIAGNVYFLALQLGCGYQEPVDKDWHATNLYSQIGCVKVENRCFSCPLKLNLFKNMPNQNTHWFI